MVNNMVNMKLKEFKENAIAKGIEKGIGIGIEIGKLKKAKEIALYLLENQKNMSIEEIAWIVDVSATQIQGWVDENHAM